MPNWKKVITSGSNASLNSLQVTSGVTGSLQGTSSWALNNISSSYAVTSSYSLNGGVTKIIAGSNVTISPTSGIGQVTINSTAGGGSPTTVSLPGNSTGTTIYTSTSAFFLGYLRIDYYAVDSANNSTFAGSVYATFNDSATPTSTILPGTTVQIGGGIPVTFNSSFTGNNPCVTVDNSNPDAYDIVFTATEV